MPDLYQFIYASLIAPGEPLSSVATIARVSRLNNERCDVTGLLVFDGERFVQYLEGPQGELGKLAKIISVDRRHTDFTVLHEGAFSGDRNFPSWSLAYASAPDEHTLPLLAGASGLQALAQFEDLRHRLHMQP
jgi:hypothetical protein